MPKRTSEKRKRLTGSPNAKPVTASAPINPLPASGLDAIGRAEWKRIREAFAATGRLTELDEAVLCMYCAAYSRWKRAEASLLQQGDVLMVDVRDTHGHVTHQKPIVNPMVKIAESAGRQVHKYGESLGLSPAARTKQGIEFDANKKHEEEDEERSEFAL
jgi:P27 family predicted phage terminase small subunit